MVLAAKNQTYPYISTNSRIAGGAPIIKGTRITVRTITGYYQMGMSVYESPNGNMSLHEIVGKGAENA